MVQWCRALGLHGVAQNALAAPDIALAAEAENRRSYLRHPPPGHSEVHPLAADLHVGLVDAPRWAGRPGEPVPVAFELRCVIVHPAHDGGVSQQKAALRHHLHQIAVAGAEPQLPPHAQDDDLPVEVAALEQPSSSARNLAASYCLQPIGGPGYGSADGLHQSRPRFVGRLWSNHSSGFPIPCGLAAVSSPASALIFPFLMASKNFGKVERVLLPVHAEPASCRTSRCFIAAVES